MLLIINREHDVFDEIKNFVENKTIQYIRFGLSSKEAIITIRLYFSDGTGMIICPSLDILHLALKDNWGIVADTDE